jgi:hypothetical protein
VVRLKHTYERLHREFGRYTSVVARDTELSFDAGGSTGRVTQMLKGGDPLFLDQKDGRWYLLFSWSSHWSLQLLQGQDWGPDQNGHGQRVAVLQGASFKPVSICALPDEFQQPNFLVRYAEADELSRFDGKRVTLQDKRKYLNSYPLLPGAVRLERPSARSELACKSSSQPSQGENK